MRWEDERYVRLYTRDTATWKLLPWQGRALLPLLLRKADRLGLVDVEGDRVEGVAALVDLPPEVVAPGLTGLLARGVVVEAPGGLAFPRYVEAQEARASDRLRAQDYRARKTVTQRDDASRNVTVRHDSSHGVTRRHTASHSVTPSLAEPSLATTPPTPSPGVGAGEGAARAGTVERTGFTAEELSGLLRSRAGGKVLAAGADVRVLAALQRAMDDATRAGATRESYETLADWYAAGSQGWRTGRPLGLVELSSAGTLAEHLERAAQWASSGRQPITHGRGGERPARLRPAPVSDWPGYVPPKAGEVL